MDKSNCVAQAWREYLRLRRKWAKNGRVKGEEPYVWLRSSRLTPGWVLHVGVEYWDGSAWMKRSFRPLDVTPLRWWQLWRVLSFKGEWVDGDLP